MTAVATLQGKLLAEPSLAPFTLRAEARALARRALWWQYSAPDDLTEKNAISARAAAITLNPDSWTGTNLHIRLSSSSPPTRRACATPTRRLSPTMCLGNA